MTYLDKYKEEHPGLSDEEYQRIVKYDCPIGKDGNTILCPSQSIASPGIGTACPVCWNLEIPGTEPSNKTNNEREETKMENKKFTKDDIRVGHVVKYRNGEVAMALPTYLRRGEYRITALNGLYGWGNLDDDYTTDMLVKNRSKDDYDIMEVYGYSKYAYRAHNIETDNRELLWKREEKTCDQCIHKVVCSHVGMCEHFAEKK